MATVRRARRTQEMDHTEDEQEQQPRKGSADIVESQISIKARRSKKEPEDVTRFKRRPTKPVTVIAVALGFDGLKRVRPGAKFVYNAPLDDEEHVILPTWAVLERDYQPEPETELPPGMKPKVRGGASQGGLKPQL